MHTRHTHTLSLYHLTATHVALLQQTPHTVDHDHVALLSLRNVMDKGEHLLFLGMTQSLSRKELNM